MLTQSYHIPCVPFPSILKLSKKLLCYPKFFENIQGGSDKSGLLHLFLENLTAQLKIIRFYKTKKKFTYGHIENQYIQ